MAYARLVNATMPATSDSKEVADRLLADGYVVVTGMMDDAGVDAARADLDRVLGSTPTGRNSFEGFSAQRVYALFAKTKSVIGLYKTELIKPAGPWRTAEQVEFATLSYVDWFNHHRLYETCGDIPPAELEDAYIRSERRPHRGRLVTKPSVRTRRGDSIRRTLPT